MKICPIIVIFAGVVGTMALSHRTIADEGDSLWSQTYGGVADEEANAIIPSGDGGFLLAGYTGSFGMGGNLWLLKVSASGDSLWSRSYGGYYYEEAYSIVPSGDGDFLIAGYTSSFGTGGDMWLMKVNAAGDSLWSRTYGGSGIEWANAIVASGDGGFLLAGGTDSFGSGASDMWLVKIDAEGDSLWSRTYGGPGDDGAKAVILTDDGGFLLAGATGSFGAGVLDMWLVKVNANGDSLWSYPYGGADWDEGYAVASSDDGGYLVVGHTGSFGEGLQDLWLMKVNSDGDSLWSHTYGGAGWEEGYSIIALGDGSFLLAGWTGGSAWLIKVNAVGDSLWSRTYGGIGAEQANSVIQTGSGDFLVAGWTESFGVGMADVWLLCVEGGGVPVAPQPSVQPTNFVFYSPYPNPFNPVTVLRFDLPVASRVKLEVFDVNGRSVGAGFKSAHFPAGAHRIFFDGSDLPSGIYFARLTAGEYVGVKKMVQMK